MVVAALGTVEVVAAFALAVDCDVALATVVVVMLAAGALATVVDGAVAAAAVVDGAADALNASHPVITSIPEAPVAPVMRRAFRAGCGRRRFFAMGSIIELAPQSTLGTR
jgi:hypothetical protein